MSEQTKLALDEAIAAHIADEEPGAILTGYVAQAQYTTADFMDGGYTGYLRVIQEGQGWTTTLGLATYLRIYCEAGTLTHDDD